MDYEKSKPFTNSKMEQIKIFASIIDDKTSIEQEIVEEIKQKLKKEL